MLFQLPFRDSEVRLLRRITFLFGAFNSLFGIPPLRITSLFRRNWAFNSLFGILTSAGAGSFLGENLSTPFSGFSWVILAALILLVGAFNSLFGIHITDPSGTLVVTNFQLPFRDSPHFFIYVHSRPPPFNSLFGILSSLMENVGVCHLTFNSLFGIPE